MTETRTLTLDTSDGPITVEAHPTDTDGLYVHRAHDHDAWRLSHHSGLAIGEFTYEPHAYNAAKDVAGLADWAHPADQILANAAVFYIYEIHDAIHENGGTFLYRAHGPAAHALAARGD
uniref:hypothetical protein n=1 Tax=Streptomyces tubercidicus TaxID=47759 RepID=UPI0037DCA203|nr:hypothetical protein OG690_38145 [Streptomyces tubercidicus]